MAENKESISLDPISEHPPLVMPSYFMLPARRRIMHMMPGEMAFASSVSVVVDDDSDRLLIDTKDLLPPPMRHANERRTRPAILRIMRLVGAQAYDGYLIDHRHIEVPQIRKRGGEYGEAPEAGEEWSQNRTHNPLGVVFQDEERTGYLGLDGLEETAHFFAAAVDAYLETLQKGSGHDKAMVAFEDYFAKDENMLK